MWVFDTLLESFDGRRHVRSGRIEVNTQYSPQRNPVLVTLKVIASLLLLAGGAYGLLQIEQLPKSGLSRFAIVAGVELIYVAIAFFIVPRPNDDDVGFLGGLINDPFRYSDNYNRSLRSWYLLLGPGRFISASLLDFAALLGVMKPDAEEEAISSQASGDAQAAVSGSSVTSAVRTDLELPADQAQTPEVANVQLAYRGDFD
ncbi:MAG: hypothetical protein ACIALR_11365 [Blastopirellula sp. JB062]